MSYFKTHSSLACSHRSSLFHPPLPGMLSPLCRLSQGQLLLPSFFALHSGHFCGSFALSVQVWQWTVLSPLFHHCLFFSHLQAIASFCSSRYLSTLSSSFWSLFVVHSILFTMNNSFKSFQFKLLTGIQSLAELVSEIAPANRC